MVSKWIQEFPGLAKGIGKLGDVEAGVELYGSDLVFNPEQPLFVWALPGTGKTTLTSKAPDLFVDLDDVTRLVAPAAFFAQWDKETADVLHACRDVISALCVELYNARRAMYHNETIFLANLMIGEGYPRVALLPRSAEKYVEIVRSGRSRAADFGQFTDDDLHGWYTAYHERAEREKVHVKYFDTFLPEAFTLVPADSEETAVSDTDGDSDDQTSW